MVLRHMWVLNMPNVMLHGIAMSQGLKFYRPMMHMIARDYLKLLLEIKIQSFFWKMNLCILKNLKLGRILMTQR